MEFNDLKNKNIELSELVALIKEDKNLLEESFNKLSADNKNLEIEIRELIATLSATKVKLSEAEEEVELSEAAKNQVTVLNIQIADLREQLSLIESLLDILKISIVFNH